VFTEAEYNLVVGDLSVSYGLNTSYFNTLPEVTGFPSVQNVEEEYNSVSGNVPVENNFVGYSAFSSTPPRRRILGDDCRTG
jgi:hypothetical protein